MSTHHYGIPRLLPLLFGLLMATLAYGQRPVQILYFSAPAEAPTKAFLYVEKGLIAETELPRSNFSKTFELPKGELRVRFLPGLLGEGENMPKSAPVVKIPETWEKILLLVFEDRGNTTLPIRVQAIDASDNVFGPGSVYMANFSDIGVMGTLGDKRLLLKPKSVEIIKNPVSKNGYYPAQLDKVVRGGEKPMRFVRQMWGYDSQVRQFFFILPKPAPLYATYYCAPIEGLDAVKKGASVSN